METSLTERATWRDYYELCKPNVVWLMILTAIVGMCMATPGVVAIDTVVFASLGIALCAGSAAAINHLADQHVDAVMARTSGRPIVKGKIDSQGAAIFAFILGSLHGGVADVGQCPDRVADLGLFGGLRLYLHAVPETCDPAEHCDWWLGGCHAAAVGLDGGH